MFIDATTDRPDLDAQRSAQRVVTAFSWANERRLEMRVKRTRQARL